MTNQCHGQLVVDNSGANGSPNYLVQNILMGNGVTASNISFTGDSLQQIGFFDGTASNIGVPSGIILATGHIDVALGPNDETDGSNPPFGMGTPGDADLAALTGNVTSDAGVLEFDFVPIGDSVVFAYVFASEEYNEYVCSQYNDVFGFFISGPGYSGPFTNGAENIALLPDTNIPVSINTINNGNIGWAGVWGGCGGVGDPGLNNSVYFVDNDNPPGTSVQYDGFTIAMEAKAIVQCGETYHIKIAVADGGPSGGAYYDSAVFLEAESFYSPGVSVSVSTATGNQVIVEGCQEAVITFSRPDTIGDYMAYYQISGDAINGTDYIFITDSIQIDEGTYSSDLYITPIADGLIEGTDKFIVTIFNVTPCGDTLIQSISLVITDEYSITVDAGMDTINCAGYFTVLSAAASGGMPAYDYTWSNGSTGSAIVVTPQQPDTFIVSVTDAAGCAGMDDTVIVNTIPLPIMSVSIVGDSVICVGDTVTLTASGGIGYVWSGGVSDSVQTVTVSPDSTAEYVVQAYDSSCNSLEDTITIQVFDYPVLSVSYDMNICEGDSVDIMVVGALSYQWSGGTMDTDSVLTVAPSISTTYYIVGNNGPCASQPDSVIVTVTPQFVIDLTNDTILCPGDTLILDASTTGATYLWQDNSTSAINLVSQPGLYWVHASTGSCQVVDTIEVEYHDQPTVDLGSDTTVCEDATLVLDASAPVLSYVWQDNSNGPTLSITEEGTYWVLLADQCGTISDTIVVSISECECLLCVPDVFFPHGNGNEANRKLYVFDKWWESGELLDNIDFKIYNRWGDLIFEATERSQIIYPDGGWDGTHMRNHKEMEVGVYVWIMQAISVSGLEIGPVSGNVTLLK